MKKMLKLKQYSMSRSFTSIVSVTRDISVTHRQKIQQVTSASQRTDEFVVKTMNVVSSLQTPMIINMNNGVNLSGQSNCIELLFVFKNKRFRTKRLGFHPCVVLPHKSCVPIRKHQTGKRHLCLIKLIKVFAVQLQPNTRNDAQTAI